VQWAIQTIERSLQNDVVQDAARKRCYLSYFEVTQKRGKGGLSRGVLPLSQSVSRPRSRIRSCSSSGSASFLLPRAPLPFANARAESLIAFCILLALHSSFLLTFNTTLFSLFFWYRRRRRVSLKFARNNLNFLISTKKKIGRTRTCGISRFEHYAFPCEDRRSNNP
jgi:hypothetical protein